MYAQPLTIMGAGAGVMDIVLPDNKRALATVRTLEEPLGQIAVFQRRVERRARPVEPDVQPVQAARRPDRPHRNGRNDGDDDYPCHCTHAHDRVQDRPTAAL